MANVPDDITSLILSKLPAKSLLRFKCVSKPWRCWISSPNFQLLDQQRQESRAVVILHVDGLPGPPTFHYINQQLNEEKLSSPLDENIIFDYNHSRILGSCDGLLLIRVNQDMFFLWNPTTRSCTKIVINYNFDIRYNFPQGGLCFDSSKNIYKAVMFTLNNFVMVASLEEEDKRWRRIDLPYDDLRSVKDGITFHGRLHCRINSYENPYRVISFDPISENFDTFPIPEPPKDGEFDCEIGGLGVLDDCLCMSRGFICDFSYGIEILVMKEYGVKESWTSLFFIKDRCFYAEFAVLPITAADNGEVALLIDDHTTELVVYNPKNDDMRQLFLVEYKSGCISAFTYTVSLKDTLL